MLLPSETSNFIFLMKEGVDENDRPCSHIIFINKKAFHKIFSGHSSLFRYALGPELTADKLLQEIKSSKLDFFSFFKNDKALIGILLGFGLENSLYVSRFEQVLEVLDAPQISKKLDLAIPTFLKEKNKKFMPPFEQFPIRPSLGYDSLAQELNVIENKIDIASPALENYAPKLIFGRVADSSNSSDELINSYQETQLKIINVLDHSQWLEQILSQFYGESVKILVKNKKEGKDTLINDKIDLSNVVAQAVLNRFQDEFDGEKRNQFEELIEGMKAAEKKIDAHYLAPFLPRVEGQLSFHSQAFLIGFKIWSYYKFNKFISLSSVISHLQDMVKAKISSVQSNQIPKALAFIYHNIFENIDRHERQLALSHFQTLEKRLNLDIICLEKDRLYYQQMNPGMGAFIGKDALIHVSYTLKTMHGNIVEDCSTGTVLNLTRAIKAFRASFPSMRIGEEGILFIYPEWGIKSYLSPPYFSPYLIAEFNIKGLEQ
ncbi:hypothetical protein [Candidatus Protochlamydia phocaeensis]|uniref:hypothetical protein n=1 Tax=Candidatus Protochlamydia phocaeensis TaxID=1414722 RepID=UPI0012ABAB1F|nr:hypothetical protein [Candidatus Protochlamydia phocaeensis]